MASRKGKARFVQGQALSITAAAATARSNECILLGARTALTTRRYEYIVGFVKCVRRMIGHTSIVEADTWSNHVSKGGDVAMHKHRREISAWQSIWLCLHCLSMAFGTPKTGAELYFKEKVNDFNCHTTLYHLILLFMFFPFIHFAHAKPENKNNYKKQIVQ